jgi:hypothetical protein
MDIRRINDDRQFQDGGLTEPEGLAALREAREASNALLRAADDVINRVLSRDSEQFLEQARQHRGQ